MRAATSQFVRSALLAFWVLGCGAGWHQPGEVRPGALPARQQVQVWEHGAVLRWHAVRISQDSMSGITYFRPVSCDSCRRSVPRAAVDSLRFGDPVAGFWKSLGLFMGVVIGLGVVFCWSGCSGD